MSTSTRTILSIGNDDYLLAQNASITDLLTILVGATPISDRFFQDEKGNYQKEWVTKKPQIEVAARIVLEKDIHCERTENYVSADKA